MLPDNVAVGISGKVIFCTMVSLKQPGVVILECRIRLTPGVVKVCVATLTALPAYTVVKFVTGS